MRISFIAILLVKHLAIFKVAGTISICKNTTVSPYYFYIF